MDIVFNADGSADFTRNPTALKVVGGIGTFVMHRMTEIYLHVPTQRYCIKFLTGPYSGQTLNRFMPVFTYFTMSDNHIENYLIAYEYDNIITTHTYEDAVTLEVALVEFGRSIIGRGDIFRGE